MTIQTGLGYIWHPVYLGSGISFFQEMYVGYFSASLERGHDIFFTHGTKIGLEAYGIKASAGYAGRWHNNFADWWYPWDFPWETFQFTLSSDPIIFGKRKEETTLPWSLNGTILSAGSSYATLLGRMNETIIGIDKISFSSNALWSMEADFYINENSAILSSLDYTRMTQTITLASPPYPFPSPWVIDMGVETISLESGFRYHPIDVLHPLFIQFAFGVIRMNPVYETTSPRYIYKTFSDVAIGCLFTVTDLGIVLLPRVGLRTIFMEITPDADLLGGYNQLDFGVNVGYKF